jgi:transposase, IS5 family
MGLQRTSGALMWSEENIGLPQRFSVEMGAMIPRPRLAELIAPHHPNRRTGACRGVVQRVLRIYFRPQWFDLSDPQADDGTHDNELMCRTARVDAGPTRERQALT